MSPQMSVEFEVICGHCNGGLCRSTTVDERHNVPVVIVDPCEKCLEDAKDEGRAEADK